MRAAFRAAFDDDPLLYNETTSVAFLASAAARTGMFTLAEYVSTKRWVEDRRWNAQGRCDLWLADPSGEWSWSLEFKQMFCRPTPRANTVKRRLERACTDVGCVDAYEASRKFGALLVSGGSHGELTDEGIKQIEQVAQEEATMACRIGGSNMPVYLLLKCVS
jgi:hypothetical protein